MTDDDRYETDAGRRSTKIPTEADILLSQATSPGNNRCIKSNGAEIVKAHIPRETGLASANSRVANTGNDAQTT